MKVERSGAAFLFGQDRNLLPDFEIRPSMDAMQLGALERMERALAIYPIIVWRILHLVARGRDCPDLPCDAVLDPRNGGPPDHGPALQACPAPPSPGEMVRLIAGFGGFLGRKCDGYPGPKALWEGMQKVQAFAIGIATAKQAFVPSG